MIQKLLCWLLGHRTVRTEAITQVAGQEFLGMTTHFKGYAGELGAPIRKKVKYSFCLRCGKPVHKGEGDDGTR